MSKETINILLFVGGAELVFLLFILCIVMFLKGLGRKKKDRKATETLVQNIKKNDDSRREKLLQVFSECYDLKDEELNKVVDEFVSREHAFYKVMISVYLNRDAAEFAQLNTQLEEVIKPYSDLTLSNDLAGRGEIESLKETNEELMVENRATKKVVDQLMEEYSRSFDKDNQGVKPEAFKELPGEKTGTSDTDRDEGGIVESEEVLEQIDLAEGADEPRKVDDNPEEPVIAEPEEVLDDLDLMVEDIFEGISEETVVEEISADVDLMAEEAKYEEAPEITQDDEAIISEIEVSTEADVIQKADLVVEESSTEIVEDIAEDIVEDIVEDLEVVSEDNNTNGDLADLVAEIQTASAESTTVTNTDSEPVETETDVDLDLIVEETTVSNTEELLAEESDDLGVEELMPEEDEDELDEELESLLS